MVRVTISRRDTADTAITAELLISLHVQSFSLSPGTEVDCSGGSAMGDQSGDGGGVMGTEVDWSGGGVMVDWSGDGAMGTEVNWSGGGVMVDWSGDGAMGTEVDWSGCGVMVDWSGDGVMGTEVDWSGDGVCAEAEMKMQGIAEDCNPSHDLPIQ